MSQSPLGTKEFGKWRAFLWPVHRHELKKLIPMLLIFFLISFNQNVLRSLKDTLVITAKSSGAEVIPFIKVWMLLPGAFLFTYIFTRLSNRLVRERVFYVMISLFLGYFLVFTVFVYPMRDVLHPNALADSLQESLPLGFKGLIAMFRNWTFTSFYVMSELWSNIILSMLFWGFANQVTRIGEAKRFYGLFGIGANLSGIAAGQASVFLCNNNLNPYFPGHDAWEQSFNMIMVLVLLSGFFSIAIFRWMHNEVLSDPVFYDSSLERAPSNVKGDPQKLSMRESFAYLLRSKYLTSIALIVISYNIVINLVEVVWKHQVRELYPNPLDYNWYMGQVTTLIGVLATLTSLFVAGNSVRKFGWTFTALLTPIVLLITSIGFFGFFFLKPYLTESTYLTMLGISPLAIVVFFGSAQNLLSRAAKYTVFDSTKEMAFVPLGPECKLKGKAVIDGVCSRLGKSGGSIIHQSLLLTFATITASAPYVAGSLFIIIGLWSGATRVLGAQFNEMTQGPGNDVATKHTVEPLADLKEQQAT
jgi:AAA family ATP:ADP antiporter